MEFTRLDFLRMIYTMQKYILCDQGTIEEKDLLHKLDNLFDRVSVDRDKIILIGIKD